MASDYKVIWSDEALKNVTAIIDWLDEQWTQREVNTFLKRLAEAERLLSKFPKAFPSTENGDGYRRLVLTKTVVIYYKSEGENVKIRTVFDTRQDPDKLNLD